VEFDDSKKIQKITGEKKIEFKRSEVSGTSERVIWKFSKKIITFFSKARLTKSNSGTSSGEEIQFYIEDERVVVKSTDGKRSETKID